MSYFEEELSSNECPKPFDLKLLITGHFLLVIFRPMRGSGHGQPMKQSTEPCATNKNPGNLRKPMEPGRSPKDDQWEKSKSLPSPHISHGLS